MSALRLAPAIALAVVPLMLSGCAYAVAGTAKADPAAVAQIVQERACTATGDAVITAVRTMVQRVDSGGVLDGRTADAMLDEIPVAQLGSDLGRACGPDMISAEYSRLLVELNSVPASTFFGRVALNASITGLCRVDQSFIVLNQQARLVCAGRSTG